MWQVWGRTEVRAGFWWDHLKDRDQLENLGLWDNIKTDRQEMRWGAWNGLIWRRVYTSCGLFWKPY